MDDTGRVLGPIVRNLAGAARALRLYPPASPLPKQAAEAACQALRTYFETENVLPLTVKRGSLACRDWDGAGIPGVAEMADALGAHGIAELDFVGVCQPSELISFLHAALLAPEEAASRGGLPAMLASEGIESIRVVQVNLTTIEAPMAMPEGDVDEFLAELASDPGKLGTWLQAAFRYDNESVADGIAELAGAAGADGLPRLSSSMAEAFLAQSTEGKDRLLEITLDSERIRSVTSAMLERLRDADIAAALTSGRFGKNMLSLSSAINRLPVEGRTKRLAEETRTALPAAGHGEKEVEFFDHMLDVRTSGRAEPALAEDPRYVRAAELSVVPEHEKRRAKGEVEDSDAHLNRQAVAALTTLLDQETDFELYARSLQALGAMVPRLLEKGETDLAVKIVTDLSRRESRATLPPRLVEQLRESLSIACSTPSMTALLALTGKDLRALELGREMVRVGGEAAARTLAEAALTSEDERAMDSAAQVLGKRLPELMAAASSKTQWFHVAKLAKSLAMDGSPRCTQALEALMSRKDEQSRREAAKGLAVAGGPLAARHLKTLLGDPSPEVAIVAARVIGRTRVVGAAETLSARLADLDLDGKDFLLGREIITALAQIPSPAAEKAIKRVVDRRMLIKRGRFAEVQAHARNALEAQKKKGIA